MSLRISARILVCKLSVKVSIILSTHVDVFQAKIFTLLVCVPEGFVKQGKFAFTPTVRLCNRVGTHPDLFRNVTPGYNWPITTKRLYFAEY